MTVSITSVSYKVVGGSNVVVIDGTATLTVDTSVCPYLRAWTTDTNGNTTSGTFSIVSWTRTTSGNPSVFTFEMEVSGVPSGAGRAYAEAKYQLDPTCVGQDDTAINVP
jgi:hypothetical protein